MKMIRSLLVLLIILVGIDAISQRIPAIPANRGQGRTIIPGKFIITLTEGVNPLAVAREDGMIPDHVYTRVLNGMAGTLGEAARTGMLRDRRVVRIEQDVVVTADQTAWGLDRIDQRRLPLSGTYTRTYSSQGVNVYVIDAGTRYDHIEFGGRASFGYDVFGGNGSDCNGHGTHVAAIIGGNTYGVANRASLVSVRLLDCNGSGSMSGIIAAMDWIAANRRLPAVANLSLGGSYVAAMNDALTRLTNAGVLVVVAAGNENINACNTSPASAPDAITVGATDQNDGRASFSNYGSCLDFFAPGVSIPAAYHTASNAYGYMSGTSMAAPHVGGAAALILQHNPSVSARGLRDLLYSYSTRGIVANSLSTNNHLLYSLEQTEGTTSPPANRPPTANFTQSCTNLGCSFTDLSTDADGTVASWLWNFGNGVTSAVKNPTYSYPSAGTYTVTLRVADNGGATATTSRTITVSAPTSNTPPTASFSASCTGLTCSFTDRSSDASGSIVSWRWNFGNGVTSTTRNPSYTYPVGGTYNVSLTVTDNQGATSSVTGSVAASSSSQITLTLRGYKISGYEYVELRWSGATSQYVDIYMNGSRIGTVSNSGGATHRTNLTGPRTLTYKVCNYGTSTCSPNVSVTFY